MKKNTSALSRKRKAQERIKSLKRLDIEEGGIEGDYENEEYTYGGAAVEIKAPVMLSKWEVEEIIDLSRSKRRYLEELENKLKSVVYK